VEFIWRTDNRGWVLYLTIERADSRRPGEGVTLDDCSELSRDLSTALDVADVIPLAYRLEVGTPGLERQLYNGEEYKRFSGHGAKIKLKEPLLGEWSMRGTLQGLDEEGRVLIDTDRGLLTVAVDNIDKGNLVLDFGGNQHPKRTTHKRGAKASQASGKPAAAGKPTAKPAKDYSGES
jgi:ribosome maturation factor RimP